MENKQPPSGGCVLKLVSVSIHRTTHNAAAFGRLCVETPNTNPRNSNHIAAAFGRLCVETAKCTPSLPWIYGSRLRAAVC